MTVIDEDGTIIKLCDCCGIEIADGEEILFEGLEGYIICKECAKEDSYGTNYEQQ